MKKRHIIALAALACICWAMTSCGMSPESEALAREAAAIALAEYQRQHPVPAATAVNPDK